MRRQPQLRRQLGQEVDRLVSSLQELVEVAADGVVRQRRHVVAQHPGSQRNLRQEVNLYPKIQQRKEQQRTTRFSRIDGIIESRNTKKNTQCYVIGADKSGKYDPTITGDHS